MARHFTLFGGSSPRRPPEPAPITSGFDRSTVGTTAGGDGNWREVLTRDGAVSPRLTGTSTGELRGTTISQSRIGGSVLDMPRDITKRPGSSVESARLRQSGKRTGSIIAPSSISEFRSGGKEAQIDFESMLDTLNKKFSDLVAENRLLIDEVLKLRPAKDASSNPEESLTLQQVTQDLLDEAEQTDSTQGVNSQQRDSDWPEKVAEAEDPESDEVDNSDVVFAEWPIEQRLKQKANRTIQKAKMHLVQLPLVFWNEAHVIAIGDRCVASPVGRIRLTWDSISFCLFVLQLWMTPFMLFFLADGQVPLYFSLLEDITTVFFLFDIIFNFNTGVIITSNDGEDSVVMIRSGVCREYCKGFFWIDLFSTVPFDKLTSFFESGVNHQFLASFRILRLARWLKLLRFLRMLSTLRMLHARSKGFELQMQRLKNVFLVPVVAALGIITLAHSLSCTWRALSRSDIPGDPFALYYVIFTHSVFAMLTGARIDDGDGGALYMLDIFIGTLRLCCGGFGIYWLLNEAIRMLQRTQNEELIKEQILAYMGQRGISEKTQLLILNQLQECNKVASAKRRFDIWMDSGIPSELHRSISKELWHHRLSSLGIIDVVFNLQPQIVVELALLVREEILARLNVLFKEGDMPVAAYMIIDGVVHTASSLMEEEVPDFTVGMWVGEKALVNPSLVRTITAVCKTMCTLMAVPADGFRHLLIDFDILRHFETYCVEHLWHGICGRCGVVGDHFANDCPLIWLSEKNDHPKRARTSQRLLEYEQEYAKRGGCWSPLLENDHPHEGYQLLPEAAAPERAVKRDLKEFLRTMEVTELLPVLERHDVRSMSELACFPPERVNDVIAEVLPETDGVDEDGEAEFNRLDREILFRQAFECDHIDDFINNLEERAKEVLGTVDVRSQHLIFISHHKLDAGTEASLLRQELETLIKHDPELRKKQMDAPVFLDSEDLNDLEALQEHVQNSHNILLLMTKDVLTRPWVLVEIATAHRLGVPIVPIEIRKAGLRVRYPDENFYAKIADGTLLPLSSKRVLQACQVSPMDVENSIRKVFNRISFPYSPHRPAALRLVEVQEFLKRCTFQDSASHLQKKRKAGPSMAASSTHARVHSYASSTKSDALARTNSRLLVKKEPEDKTVHTVRC